MKRTVSMLTAALFVGAMAMPAFAQAPAESPAAPATPAASAATSASGAGTDTAATTRTKRRHRKHHHKTMQGGASNVAAEGKAAREKLKGEAAAPVASPAAQ